MSDEPRADPAQNIDTSIDIRDALPAPLDPLPPQPARLDWRSALWKTAFALLISIGVWWLVWTSLSATPRDAHWSHHVFIPASILFGACLVALRHEKHWASPLRKFLELVPRIRAGQAPIEQIVEVGGGLDGVAHVVKDLFHEIRRQQLAMAQLQQEIRDRVANRTDALERQINTLRQQAARDALTGLYNRRMLDTLLPKLLERCREERADLAVLMIDVDYFKQLNDTFGHSAGDELLRNIAHLIQSSLGQHDLAIRYGGDEFLILKSGATLQSAQELSQRLSMLVDQMTRPMRLSAPPRLSIGVALLSQLGHATAQELLEAADRSLYDVKNARRQSASSDTQSPMCA
jgi:diguanylate cyclase (GGDEF)-like protein